MMHDAWHRDYGAWAVRLRDVPGSRGDGLNELLARRMREARDYCLARGCPLDILPVSAAKPPAGSAEVAGVSLVLLERFEK